MDPDHCIFIRGFGLSGYRSFGPEMQRIGPCKKINLVIGQNNSGKSNILKFVQDYVPKVRMLAHGSAFGFEGLERYRTDDPINPRFALLLEAKILSQQWYGFRATGRDVTSYVQQILASGAFGSVGGDVWMQWEMSPSHSGPRPAQTLAEAMASIPGSNNLFENFSLAVVHSSSGPEQNISNVLAWLAQQWMLPSAECVSIQAIRQPGTAEIQVGSKRKVFSGNEIIHELAQLRDPDHDTQHLSEGFERVQNLVREVLDRPDARLQIPYKRDTITVHMDKRSLPLHALGTGVHEVIIIAAAATSLRKHIVCIEEPEIHLHPLLQKKLLRYLDTQTDNQYFISTHSAHFLDHKDAAIFHVRLTEEGSKVNSVVETSERFAICTDLGYRASDLLQTNCIIWVEGPSDRAYLSAWLKLDDPDLAEGIDYSIMFYGGRLLSHVSPEDPEVDEFISLRHLNRNMVVLMDSDRKSKNDTINETKQRIVADWKNHPGFAWVTAGREIENYVSPAAMVEALESVAPKRGPHSPPKDRYAQCIRVVKKVAIADKLKVAHWLADNGKLVLDVLDLEDKIKNLSKFIRSSNHSMSVRTKP